MLQARYSHKYNPGDHLTATIAAINHLLVFSGVRTS